MLRSPTLRVTCQDMWGQGVCAWRVYPKTGLGREQRGSATPGWSSSGRERASLLSPLLRKGPTAWQVELDVVKGAIVRWEGTSPRVGGPCEGPEDSGPGGSGTG